MPSISGGARASQIYSNDQKKTEDPTLSATGFEPTRVWRDHHRREFRAECKKDRELRKRKGLIKFRYDEEGWIADR